MNMKRIGFFIVAMVVSGLCATVSAVTEKEWDQARTIAAQAYLRYANDGSGYLDDVNATSMSQLESVLKTKEQENIKAFKAVKTPTDYASWNKEKLVEYWGVTFFTSSGLSADGIRGRMRARKRLADMSVSDVAETPAKAESEVVSLANDDAAQPGETVSLADDSAETNLAETDSIASQADADAGEVQTHKGESSTWIYVLALCILVGVVVWLVIYASKSFKNNQTAPSPVVDSSSREELSAKSNEIAALMRKNESLTAECDKYRRLAQDYKGEIDELKSELAELKDKSVSSATASVSASQAVRPKHSIYLGRVNDRGIFVSASRELISDSSVYRLETSDGMSGTFTVAEDRNVWHRVLLDPEMLLGNACGGCDLLNTENMQEIKTLTPGTAVFEGGRWHVTRRARIQYC
jgi:hypothetical protein